MAVKCPACGSADTAAAIDNSHCLNCGAIINAEGKQVEPGLGQSTRDAIEAQLKPREHNVVGNLADVQRLGAIKAPDPSEPAFQMPAGADPDKVPTDGVDGPNPGGDTSPSSGKSSGKK